jgi:mono/diheme cytochrome c family protein
MALAARLGKEKSVLLERTDIADAYVKTVVRYGFRMMPPFKTTEISDADLDALAAYVASGGGKRPVAATGPSP